MSDQKSETANFEIRFEGLDRGNPEQIESIKSELENAIAKIKSLFGYEGNVSKIHNEFSSIMLENEMGEFEPLVCDFDEIVPITKN